LNFEFGRWKILKKIKKATGPACQRPKPTCLGQRAPTCARRHHSGSVTVHHLAPVLSTARHLCSTRSSCSHRLHVRAAPLCRIAATPRSVPLLFLSSRQAPAPLCSAYHRAPPSCASEPRQASHDPEPQSSVGNHRSAEPTTFFFTCRGRLPIERHLQPPTRSSATAVTSARV
jgi:hypothetical protein